MADRAVVDQLQVVRAVLAQARATGRVDGELDAGAPPEAVPVPRHRLDRDRHLQTGEPLELLADHARLQRSLGRQRHVLEVAASAPARAGEGAGRGDPVGRGLQHLDRVAAQEPRTLLALGDLHDHALSRQRMPDEDHLAVVAGDAVPAVRHRPHLDVEALPHQRPAARLALPGPPGHLVRSRRLSPTTPRRTSPGRGLTRSRSTRCLATCDERSW